MKKSIYFPILSIVLLLFLSSESNVRAAPPIANDDTNVIAEGASIQVFAPGLLINDQDPEAGPLTISTTPITPPAHGNVVLQSNGSYTYTHNGSETDSDSFVYQVCNNEQLCDTATVNITVIPVNDPPAPINDSINVAEGNSASQSAPGVLGNDQDAEGDTLSVTPTPVTPPAHGSLTLNSNGSFNYTHDGSETSSDSFVYQVCDNGTPSLCANGTVNITINPVNDAPTANDDEAALLEGSSITVPAPGVLANDVDPDVGDSVKVNPATPTVLPQHGSVTLNINGSYTYTHNGSETTADSFAYRACDAGTPRKCDEATVFIIIEPVNDAPKPQDDQVTVAEGDTAVVPAPGVLDNDTDPENGVLTVGTSAISGPSHGTVALQASGAYTYTHDGSETVSDSFVYQVCDDGDPFECGQATVQVTITAVNDAPAIDLNVSPERQDVNAGNPALFTVVVTNTGNVPLTSVSLVNTLVDNCDRDLGMLDAGQVNSYSCEFPNVINSFLNQTQVSGLDPLNDTVSDSTITFVNVNNPILDIIILPPSQDVVYGGTANFSIGILNISNNVDLNNVTISVPEAPNCSRSLGALAAGTNTGYTCSLSNITSEVILVATVTANNANNGTPISATDFGEVQVFDMTMTLEANPTTLQQPGGTVQYAVSIVNQNSKAELTLESLMSEPYGDLTDSTNPLITASSCVSGATIGIRGGSYTCAFDVELLGLAGAYEATVTAVTSDDASRTLQKSDSATVQMIQMIYLPIASHNRRFDEPNNTPCQSYPISLNTTNEFLAEDENDWYRFLLSEAGQVTIDLTNFVPKNGQIWLWSGSCNNLSLISIGTITTADKTINLGVRNPGTYHILIVNGGNVNFDDPYQLRVYLNYFEGPWEQEPNNSDGQANGRLRPNQPYFGYPNDEKDYFFIHLDQPGRIVVNLHNYASIGQLQLFHQNTNDRVGLATAPPYHLDYTGPAGTYYIYIATSDGFNSTTPYTLKVDY